MADYQTVTLAEIKELDWAAQQADSWRGGLMASDMAEYDEGMVKVFQAVASVKRDRAVLRTAIKFLKILDYDDRLEPSSPESEAYREVMAALGVEL